MRRDGERDQGDSEAARAGELIRPMSLEMD